MKRDTISRVFRSSFPDIDAGGLRTNAWRMPGQEVTAQEPLFPTVLHAFVHAQRSARGITVIPDDIDGEEETRSYGDIVAAAQHFAGRLVSRGVKPGDRVLVVLPTSFEYVIVFFAVQLVGAIPVPSYPPAMLEKAEIVIDRLVHIASHSGAAWFVTGRKLRLVLGDVALRVDSIRELISIERLGAEGRAGEYEARARGKDAAFIQYTSGSTGHPKGVVLSHRNLVSNVHAIGQALHISRRDVGVSWLPLYHDMGLIGVMLFCVYWQIPMVLMSPMAFLMRPSRWLQAISRHGGTLSPAPNFAFTRCIKRVTDEEARGLDLSTWRVALNGAEPVNLKTVQAFQKKFGPRGFSGATMLPVYGLAESSLAVTFTPQGERMRYETVDRQALADGEAVISVGEGAITVVSVGLPVPGTDVAVVDEQGRVLRDRQVGHIVCRGPSVMEGYFQDPEKTAEVLLDGWLWTGDLGYFVDGWLHITGRAKDLIIIRGRNYYAEDLEVQAEQVTGVRIGSVVAFGVYDEEKAQDVVVVVCETRLTDEAERSVLADAVMQQVQQASGVNVDEVVTVEPGTIPKTSSGKRQRGLTRVRYLAGELEPKRTSTAGLARVFARSGLGIVASHARRLLGTRREPD